MKNHFIVSSIALVVVTLQTTQGAPQESGTIHSRTGCARLLDTVQENQRGAFGDREATRGRSCSGTGPDGMEGDEQG